MHNSRGGMIISAARGLHERYKTVFHTKKRFVIAAVMRLHAADNYKYQAWFCSLQRLIH